jgi:ketosteroid isomerase-like protein
LTPSAPLGAIVSQENVEIVRSGYEAWNRGDLDHIGGLTDDSFEWREASEVPGAGTGRGRAEFDRYLRSFEHFWHEFRFEPIEIRDAGDRVLAVVIERGRSAHGDLEVSQRFMHVWTLRRGKAVRLEGFYQEADALKAAGLSRASGRRPSWADR